MDRDREQQWLQEGRLVDGRVVASSKQRKSPTGSKQCGEETRAPVHARDDEVQEQVGSYEGDGEEGTEADVQFT